MLMSELCAFSVTVFSAVHAFGFVTPCIVTHCVCGKRSLVTVRCVATKSFGVAQRPRVVSWRVREHVVSMPVMLPRVAVV